MTYKNTKEQIQKTTKQTMANLENRGHIFVTGTYENRDSVLIVWCPKHANEHSTTFYNYNRSQTGCPCCGREKVSKKLQNRQYSQETLDKMKAAASTRPFRGGKPRRWRETNTYQNWRAAVLQEFDFECAITGKQKEKSGDLVVHHINCAKNNPDLIYAIENGIVLESKLHTEYHQKYGYGGNTISQFQEFLLYLLEKQELLSMLISNLATSEKVEGSETRVYDPERVMKLHERLEEVKLIIKINN